MRIVDKLLDDGPPMVGGEAESVVVNGDGRSRTKRRRNRAHLSFEFFPPKTERGRQNLQLRIETMSELHPNFVNLTCSSASHQVTLQLCEALYKFCGVEVVMHVSTNGLTRDEARKLLERAKEIGLQNIFIIRGDIGASQEPPGPRNELQFANAKEMVEFVRKEFGSYFCIGVAGYPEGRTVYEKDLGYLKAKIDAGADFVLTQLFFEIQSFTRFVDDCRGLGIDAPIIPGIFPIQGYTSFTKITKYLKVRIPECICKALEPIKGDDAAVKRFGIQYAVEMCKDLLESGKCTGIHFYTLNLEKSVRSVVDELSDYFLPQIQRQLPWRPSAQSKRSTEDVRPIFWANRPKSYLARTDSWDEFPNGRWGDAASPAFGELNDTHFYSAHAVIGEVDLRRREWGESPLLESEIFQVFENYIRGRVKFLPWCEIALHLETSTIKDRLLELNRNGFLTINSQPRVNGAPSDHPSFGWGPSNGFVYQKAYIEFFTSPSRLHRLILKAKKHPSLIYHAVDSKGNTYTNCNTGKPCAVTWGVFPGKEVVQPTVVDPESFMVWKEEAFALWIDGWASIYEEGSDSYNLVYDIHDQYFLVNVVDNDFVEGDIFKVFIEILHDMRDELA